MRFPEKKEIKPHWDSFDKDGDGHITLDEIKLVLKSLGETTSDAEIKKLIAEVDTDSNGTIEWDEVCVVSNLEQTHHNIP